MVPFRIGADVKENADKKAARVWGILHHGMLILLLGASLFGAIYALRPLIVMTANTGALKWIIRIPAFIAIVLTVCALASRLYCWFRGEWRDTSLAIFRVGFYLFVFGSLLLWLFLQPSNAVYVLLVLYVVMGLFSLAILLGKRLVTMPPSKLIRTLDLVLLNICLVVVVAEAGLRILAWRIPSPLLITAASSTRRILVSERLQLGHIHYGFPVNSTGHYDSEFLPKEEGKGLVICIGDSFSPGVVPHYYHFTTVCERLLPGTKVYNMGISRLGPRGYNYLLMTEALPLDPDVVVINLFIGNDISDFAQTPDNGFDLSNLFDRDNFLLYVVPQRLLRMMAESRAMGRRAGTLHGEDTLVPPEANTPEEIEMLFPWVADALLEEPTFSIEAFMEFEKRRASTICRDNKSEYDPFFQAMGKIVNSAGDVPLIVMLIPDEFQVEDALWAELEPKMENLIQDRFFPQKVVSSWLEERSVPCLDLLPHLRATTPLSDGWLHLYHLRDTHFNARGNEIAGRCLAEFLKSRGFVQEGSQDQ